MLANKYGACAEQTRFKAGWQTSTERKQKDIKNKCGDCAGLDQNHGTHCKTLDVATRVTCVCDKFQERTEKDI